MQGKTRKRQTVVASREEAIERMYQAGLKHLHRPNVPSDPYFTTESVHEWAANKAAEYIAKGIIAITGEA